MLGVCSWSPSNVESILGLGGTFFSSGTGAGDLENFVTGTQNEYHWIPGPGLELTKYARVTMHGVASAILVRGKGVVRLNVMLHYAR